MMITIHWYTIPTIITVAGLFYAVFVHKDSPGYMSGIGNVLLIGISSFVSMISWIIAAFLK